MEDAVRLATRGIGLMPHQIELLQSISQTALARHESEEVLRDLEILERGQELLLRADPQIWQILGTVASGVRDGVPSDEWVEEMSREMEESVLEEPEEGV